jgi:hypothetical protein
VKVTTTPNHPAPPTPVPGDDSSVKVLDAAR